MNTLNCRGNYFSEFRVKNEGAQDGNLYLTSRCLTVIKKLLLLSVECEK